MKAFWHRYAQSRVAVVGLGVVVLFACMAVFAPVIAPHAPMSLGEEALRGPATTAWMGTDSLGRDVWSQFVYGARLAFIIGVLAASMAIFIGAIVGAVSGFAGRRVDAFLMRVTEAFQVLPRFILALVIVAMLGSGLDRIIIVIGVLSWPQAARIVRAEFLSLKEHEFVEASRAIGVPRRTIVFREILPNALPPVIVIASLDVGQAILLEAALSFLGLGDPSVMSWGRMLSEAQQYLAQAWWLSVFPGMGIFLLVLGFNLVGDGFNEAQNPKLRTH